MGGVSSLNRDCNNYENNIANNNIPLPSTIQYDGFFNSYFFQCENVNKYTQARVPIGLIKPNISFTIEDNIFNPNNEEIYISILLNSIKDGSKEINKSLDLVIALDISGSMNSFLPSESDATNKLNCLNLAKKAIKSLKEKLYLVSQNEKKHFKHRLGLCVFNGKAETIFDLSFSQNLEKLDKLLSPIEAKGGTSLHCGLKQAFDIFKADFRQEAEKKILFLTDMGEAEDSKFFKLLEDITNYGISVDIIGIGQNLDLAYAQKVVNIKDVSLHSAFKQEEMYKILVEDFELNFFPVAKDFKIDFYSNNLRILKTYGTGYKQVKSEIISSNEENESLKNQLAANQTFLNYFIMLRKYFRKRYNRVPMHILQTIGNFLKFTRKDIAEFEKLYPSEIKQETKINPITGDKETLKSVKGNMILLKAKIDDLNLHEKFNKKEFAEVVLSYVNCENGKQEKISIPVCFEFNKASGEHYKNAISRVEDNKHISEVFPQSNAINIAICLLYCAKFMRKIMKEYHQDIHKTRLRNPEKKHQSLLKDKERLNNITSRLSDMFEKRINSEIDFGLKNDLDKKIENLIEKTEKCENKN